MFNSNRKPKTAHTPLLRSLRFIWKKLPASALATRPMRAAGRLIYDRLVRNTDRNQTHQTRFLRNVPQLEVLRDLVSRRDRDSTLRVVSIGCSNGAELYSTLWVLRSARPDLRVIAKGIDISPTIVEVARRGIYTVQATAAGREVEHAHEQAIAAADVARIGGILQSVPDGTLRVHDWLREGIEWAVGDATDARLAKRLGPQDLVLACNFLGPMEDPLAEACLRNVARLVSPCGILVVDGVDLDLKARVMPTLGLTPITKRAEEAYAADPSKRDWPWQRWSHEPFDPHRPDAAFRYPTLFVNPAAMRPVP
jgi:chemotaxis protein methyltransferase CheR